MEIAKKLFWSITHQIKKFIIFFLFLKERKKLTEKMLRLLNVKYLLLYSF
ncbi:Hypothetical Protein SLY_0527 [Strawberry lethal yellows phytoplasma (CPA) str. NZSb11]|uniref:Uncharacterized protein n=1 Tax=Strawberry lethal yellows phytoplasma (CPA) str. NZSb11 TaxID=980422 RepID=R4RPR1_PHYAS|nr:Hypothetical Protein SLY_0527 [Strawberry lethal yellows phytoplasma (CPA) str. NZSb11]